MGEERNYLESFSNISQIVEFISSPIAVLVLTFFIWKLSDKVKDLHKSIHENGFVRREDIQKLHDENKEDFRDLRVRISDLERRVR